MTEPEPIPALPYNIRLEEFAAGNLNNNERAEYVFGNQVTRKNFASFLSDIFTTSRGDSTILWAQCKWLKNTRNFDYATTFFNFINAGGFSTLSAEETGKIRAIYERIPAHTSPDTLDENINLNLERVARGGRATHERTTFIRRFPVLRAYRTPDDLLRGIQSYRMRKKTPVT